MFSMVVDQMTRRMDTLESLVVTQQKTVEHLIDFIRREQESMTSRVGTEKAIEKNYENHPLEMASKIVDACPLTLDGKTIEMGPVQLSKYRSRYTIV